MILNNKIAVIIPCFKVKKHIVDVVSSIPEYIDLIIIVDDCCPEKTGDFVKKEIEDDRVKVLYHKENKGVGGAVMTGYSAAIEEKIDIFVKIDGDGQMDPMLIIDFIYPIIEGESDYTKGNRFFNLEKILEMPKMRLFGNAVLSFLTKISSGYWNVFDPTNGFTAIHRDVAKLLPFQKISNRYFFETDMLFRLNTLKCVVVDVPMDARYGDEVSNLKISKIIGEFLFKNVKNFFKRIFYNYYLRDMSIASFEFPLGIFLFIFGIVYGFKHWITSLDTGILSPSGTVMLSGISVILGLQFILAFFSYDIGSVPKRPIHKKFKKGG